MKNQTEIEEVAHIDISLIDDFDGHPFTVKDDESMEELTRSIEENGVLNPIIVRKKDGGRYEIIAGHRRKHACLLLGMKEIPVIIRELNREEAVIEMVDSNFKREHILPSERAKAYKMKMDSIKRKAGRPRKENVSPLGARVRTDEIIAREVGESRNQIQRYIRLNELTPELLEFVDDGKIGLRPAVEISFLTEDEQRDLVDFIDAEGVFPSHAQTIRMKELSRAGRLNTNVINKIMREQKGNQKEKISISVERLQKYFPRGASLKQMEEIIIKALELYRKRKREDREVR